MSNRANVEPYRFGVVGAGWRTDFFLRIAAALPGRLRLLGVVARNPERRAAVEREWDLPAFGGVEALLDAASPEFLVSSVAYGANFEVNMALLGAGVPLLCETPPAAGAAEMLRLWEAVRERGARVQVAEQFHRQPHHAARIEAVLRGRIGTPHKAYVSLCHGYHGTSLVRHYLGLTFEPARIVGMAWEDRVLDPGDRSGPPAEPRVKAHAQQIALLDFGEGRSAVFDFSPVQYFSALRRQRVTVRGELGEIVDQTLWAAAPGGEATALEFRRYQAGPEGNLEGMHLKGIQLGAEWVYHTPTAPARLSDEEIAIADMLLGMGEYVRGGREVYPLAHALQDHHLALCIRRACESGEPVEAALQPWAEA